MVTPSAVKPVKVLEIIQSYVAFCIAHSELLTGKYLLDSFVPVSGASVTPLSPSPLAAAWPVPASADDWTLTPPSGLTS